MLQRTTLSSSVPGTLSDRGLPGRGVSKPGSVALPPIPLDLTRRLRENPIGTLVRILSMPLDRAAFLWWMLILALFSAGSGVHVWMSIQIAQVETQLSQLQQEHAEIELVNAEFMWQISEYTSLAEVQRRAEGLGFSLNFDSRYMPLAQDLDPVVLTTVPAVRALPTAAPETVQRETGQPNATLVTGAADDRASGSRMTFERLDISIPQGTWMQDLRSRSDSLFADIDLGLDLLWQDLRTYGEQTWQHIAGEFFPPGTSVATNR